jgi:hypothetical protein
MNPSHKTRSCNIGMNVEQHLSDRRKENQFCFDYNQLRPSHYFFPAPSAIGTALTQCFIVQGGGGGAKTNVCWQ